MKFLSSLKSLKMNEKVKSLGDLKALEGLQSLIQRLKLRDTLASIQRHKSFKLLQSVSASLWRKTLKFLETRRSFKSSTLIVAAAILLFAGSFFGSSEESSAPEVLEAAVQERVAATASIDCEIESKAAGRALLEPMFANNAMLSFETGRRCNVLERLSHGSVVLYKSPRGPDPITLKVAALPGDTVGISNRNILTVNGDEVKNSAGHGYFLRSNQQRMRARGAGKLAADQYYLVGDNDRVLLDSTHFGAALEADILGILAEE